jgi:hypothetical protein
MTHLRLARWGLLERPSDFDPSMCRIRVVQGVIKGLAIIFDICLGVRESNQVDRDRARVNRMLAQANFVVRDRTIDAVSGSWAM